MANTVKVFGTCCLFMLLTGLVVPTTSALTHKGMSTKGIVKPNPEKDPGLYFLMAEQEKDSGDPELMLQHLRKALTLDPSSAYLSTRMGLVLARKRKLADALIMAGLASIFDPKYDEAYSLLGKIYSVTRNHDKALEYYTRALQLKPEDRNLYIFIGHLQVARNRFGKAEKTFLEMIEQFPREKQGYYYLGKVYVESKQYEKAVETFEKLLKKQGEGSAQAHVELGNIYLRLRKLSEAEEHFRESVKLDSFNIAARVSLGQTLAAQKKYSEALKVFEELSKMAPSNQAFRIKMALILAEQKQYERAKEILDGIIETRPGWDQARFYRGRVLKEQGRLEEAEEEFSHIRKGARTYLNSRILMALMFFRKKDFAKAIRYVDQAVEVAPSDPDLYHIRGTVLEELTRFNEALAAYRKAAELDATNVKLHYSLGNVLEKSGRRSEGLKQMEAILAENPDEAGALNFVGYTLVVSGGDLERAEKLIRRASQLKPDDGYVMDSLGWVLYRKGAVDESLEQLEKAAKIVKTDPIILEHLGDVLTAKGKKEQAAQAYRRSLEVNPENIVVQGKLRKLEKELNRDAK